MRSRSTLSRRAFLSASVATLALLTVPGGLAAPGTVPNLGAPHPFSFDQLCSEMQARAGMPYEAPASIGTGNGSDGEPRSSFLNDLTYDAYRLIRFDPHKARFSDVERGQFQLQAFHLGWLFKRPISLYEVRGGEARLMGFDTDDFIYEREARALVPEHVPLPGIAGFRLHHPLNRPDIMDELLAFQGASYFRALGRGSAYGLSARGLAIRTGSSEPEEFPDFTRFYIERPEPGADRVVIHAALDSPSLTGAYRFVVSPGENTVMETTARLYPRVDIPEIGIAPLTSMFLFAERNRHAFDDFRPSVHDSDGLTIERQSGEVVWRPLANPPRLASSYFSETSPKGFGLYQRDRDFAHFQDPAAHYERRPSLRVEPIGDWGQGVVRLVEIPSDLEVNDNIVAFWMPKGGVAAGQALEYRYRLIWGDLPPNPSGTRAYVYETRAGVGGVSGVENNTGSRKFVIDFKGGILGDLPASSAEDLEAVITVTQGEIVGQSLSAMPDQKIWRLVFDVIADDGAVVELGAYIDGFGRRLSESWAYQWMKA